MKHIPTFVENLNSLSSHNAADRHSNIHNYIHLTFKKDGTTSHTVLTTAQLGSGLPMVQDIAVQSNRTLDCCILEYARTVLTPDDGAAGCPEPTAASYQTKPLNIPDQRRPQIAHKPRHFVIMAMVFPSPTNMLPSGSVLHSGGKTSSERDSSLRRG